MILVTGASGTVGKAVLSEVRKNGAPVTATYRSEGEARNAPPGVTALIADFGLKNTLPAALTNVKMVFLVCSPVPELVELESNVIDACKAAGVEHVVLNSALGAADYPKSFPSWHRKVEDKLKESGLHYTILRPNGFMQNILAFNAPSIRAGGAFYSAMGNARTSFLDVRDVGTAAARVLAEPQAHTGQIYELNGPEGVTSGELAERISRVAGGPVKYVEISEETQRKTMLDAGMPEWQATALLELQQYYRMGRGGDVTDTLARLLGRASTKLNDFLEEFKESFRQQGASA